MLFCGIPNVRSSKCKEVFYSLIPILTPAREMRKNKFQIGDIVSLPKSQLLFSLPSLPLIPAKRVGFAN